MKKGDAVVVTKHQLISEILSYDLVRRVEAMVYCKLVVKFMREGFNYVTARKLARLELYGEL